MGRDLSHSSPPQSPFGVRQALQSAWERLTSSWFTENQCGSDSATDVHLDDLPPENDTVIASPPDSTENDMVTRFEEAAEILMNCSIKHPMVSYYRYTQIQNCRQLETWDCGIACLQMVLRWLRDDHYESGNSHSLTPAEIVERSWMLRSMGTQSVWTIDLIILLEKVFSKHHRNASYLLCSKTLGVDMAHHGLGYYQKAFSNDQVRVQKLFIEAHAMKLPLLCTRRLEMDKVIQLVSQEHCIAIVLLDNSVLRNATAVPTARDCSKPSYAGHYVILCGISFDPNDISQATSSPEHELEQRPSYCTVIKNPGSANETDFVTLSRLEQAWRANGTDDDIIFVAKHHRC